MQGKKIKFQIVNDKQTITFKFYTK